jgi:hypothetical protein
MSYKFFKIFDHLIYFAEVHTVHNKTDLMYMHNDLRLRYIITSRFNNWLASRNIRYDVLVKFCSMRIKSWFTVACAHVS